MKKYRLSGGRVVTAYQYGREFLTNTHKLNPEVNTPPNKMDREEIEEIGQDLLEDMVTTGEAFPVRSEGDF